MQKIKTQKGITLVALIITIIVMLILVAVTLVITLGENGIIAKARTASNDLNARQEAEKSTFSSSETEKNINTVVGGGTWNIDTGKESSVGFPNFGKQYVIIDEVEGGTCFTYMILNADGSGIRLELYDDGSGKQLDTECPYPPIEFYTWKSKELLGSEIDDGSRDLPGFDDLYFELWMEDGCSIVVFMNNYSSSIGNYSLTLATEEQQINISDYID